MDVIGLVDIPLWLILLVAILFFLYVYGTWRHDLWVSQGVPGPKPWPAIGNLPEIRRQTEFRVYTDWQKKYGRVIGYFSGVQPVLAVTDLDMLREIMVKHSNNFIDRNLIMGLRPPKVRKALFFVGGTAWKRIRNMMTPAFSASKLKLMTHYINRCTELLVQSIDSKAQAAQLIDVKDEYGSFTMDVIAGTAFGLETNSMTQQEEEPFLYHNKKLFGNVGQGILPYLMFIYAAFPWVGAQVSKVRFMKTGVLNSPHAQFFFIALEKMVDERRQENTTQSKKVPDILQLLVDAEADPAAITDFADSADDTKSNRRMTKEEVMAQGFIVLLAGYETTATTLQYLTYNLALHPDIQEKVYEEIRDQIGDASPTYDNVSQLKYLDATIRESLRLYPPVAVVDRRAQDAITVNGVTIPAGGGVTIPIYSILHDPEYFPDPEVFNPERYLEENVSKMHPVTVDLAFGYGPRKCIGMRLALLEIKFAAVRIFRKFRFLKCAETPEQINLGKGFRLSAPDVVIKVKAEVRSA